MNLHRILAGALVACTLNAALAEEVSRDAAAKDNVATEVGSFAPLEFYLRKAVLDERGTPFGAIADILIDPYTGMASAFLVKPRISRGDALQLIPINLVTPIQRGTIRAKAELEKILRGPTWSPRARRKSLRRTEAQAAFEYFGLPVAWKQAPLDRGAKPQDDDELISVASLRDRRVEDGDGQERGKISNLMISADNGKIAYVVLAVEGNAAHGIAGQTVRYPVPLAAFVVDAKSKGWMLETPAGFLETIEPMESGKPPAGVSLAWGAYVKQHYGGGMLSGVQRRRHANTSQETSKD